MIQIEKPTMVYDGECGFCMRWIEKWQKTTGDKVRYVPYQSLAINQDGTLKSYPKITTFDCKKSVQLVMPDGSRYKAARAVFVTLSLVGDKTGLMFYKYFPFFNFASELIYRWVARNRGKF